MQKVITVWDSYANEASAPYKNVNRALERGAKVLFVASSAPSETGPAAANGPTEFGRAWAVTVFVVEGTEEQLAE